MRVRVLTKTDGHAVGSVVDVDPVIAAAWIGRGDAEPVRGAPAAEVATADPQAETAVNEPRRTRRR